MTRSESCPTTGPEHTSVIGSLSCPSSRPVASSLHCSSWHSSSAIGNLPSAIPSPVFRILQSVLSVCSNSRDLAERHRRCRSNAGLVSSAARSAQSESTTASLASFLASSSLNRASCCFCASPNPGTGLLVHGESGCRLRSFGNESIQSRGSRFHDRGVDTRLTPGYTGLRIPRLRTTAGRSP